MHFSEWGQCAILRLLTKYTVAGETEMFDIMNILDGLLKQSSSAVVLSVTKIFVDLTSNRPDLQQDVLQRLKGPLLTLMAAASTELSYTVLVHIHALLTRGQRQIEEVAKHNKADDAWIIVDGDVYDVTKFAAVHPGGTQLLLEYAGKDATEDFFGLHRLEVLDKYSRLKKGRVADAGPAPKEAAARLIEVSKVPFAEPSYMQGFKSPYFDETHVKLRLEARKFFSGETMKEALECEVKSTPPSKEMRKRMGELGIIAMVQGPGEHLKIPASLCGGVVKPEQFNHFHEMVVQEERCRTMCPGYEDGLDGAVSIGLPVLLKYGSDWMKQEVVPKIVKGEETVVLAITEAFAGSDVAGLRTTAVLDASGENYIVNGTKKWITGGMYADWFVTAVRTGKAGAGGVSMMLIPRSDAVQTTVMKTKYSSSAGTAYVTYENCIVPKKYMIKGENKGFQIIMSNFNHERWMITVVCIARARTATEETFKWAMQRKVFGKPLIEQAVIREKLAQMFAGIETCTQMLWDITYNMNHVGTQGPEIGARIALLKYQTTRMNHMVCDNAVQVFGGRGVTQGAMGRAVEVFSRMYKIPAVYGGSEEIMADLAVRTVEAPLNPKLQAVKAQGPPGRVFAGDFKQFFCRYNEPSYIKQVKIDILTMLADFNSAEHVVTELSEYVTDVDAEIARRAIQAIGKIAVHVPSTSEMIVSSLTNLLELDIDYVCTEAAVVMKDLVRKYPEQFQQASGAVQKCLRIVTEPDGKSALLWILGEYGLLIEDAPYLLEPMIDSFMEESGVVQLEMLTAAVKLFFCRPPEVQRMLGCLLQKAIQECTHPDVRDRALLYYRLLQVSPEEARRVICAPKEVVDEFQEEMDVDLRDRVFDEFNSLSTVYKQPASKFIQ
ncbi:apdG, partial [Symbiodinium pilosum]